MTNLQIPIFTAREPKPLGRPPDALHPRLVAAVRWDFDIGLLSVSQLVDKYRLVLSRHHVEQIANGKSHPTIKAERCALAWCKRKWRIQCDD